MSRLPLLAAVVALSAGPALALPETAAAVASVEQAPQGLVPAGPEPQIAILFLGGIGGKIEPCQ